MASKRILAAFAIAVVAIFPAIAVAVDYVVGDEGGWNLKGNYTAWVEGKQFRIGDNLVFNYPPGDHNAIEVSGPDFKACHATVGAAVHSSGNDSIPLTTAGRKWFLCGKGNGKHCQQGMKFVITVNPNVNVGPSPASPPSPSPPPPSSSAARIRVCGYRALPMMVMMMMMILVLVATAVVTVA